MDEPVRNRASERLKAIASQAVSQTVNSQKVRSALATKFVALGLTLLCFAGGLDYFSQGDAVHAALAGLARDSGQGALVDDLERVSGRLATWKDALVAAFPDTVREWVVLVALLAGVGVLAWGLRIKLGTGTPAERGRAMWDVGRIVLGPGLVGAAAYLVVSLRGFPVLRRTTSSFVDKVDAGALSWDDVAALTAKYHGWTWHEVGPVLVLGLAGVAAASLLGLLERWRRSSGASASPSASGPRRAERARGALAVVRRGCWAGGALALGYYAAVTAVAVASYGAALPVVTWPWKVRPATFVLTLGLMSVGAAVAWTGRLLLREAAAADGGATPPAAVG